GEPDAGVGPTVPGPCAPSWNGNRPEGSAAGAAGGANKASVAEAEEVPSLAVTRMSRPVKPAGGVPENAPVVGSKASQPGSAEPSASVAASVNAESGSLNVPAGMA